MLDHDTITAIAVDALATEATAKGGIVAAIASGIFDAHAASGDNIPLKISEDDANKYIADAMGTFRSLPACALDMPASLSGDFDKTKFKAYNTKCGYLRNAIMNAAHYQEAVKTCDTLKSHNEKWTRASKLGSAIKKHAEGAAEVKAWVSKLKADLLAKAVAAQKAKDAIGTLTEARERADALLAYLTEHGITGKDASFHEWRGSFDKPEIVEPASDAGEKLVDAMPEPEPEAKPTIDADALAKMLASAAPETHATLIAAFTVG